VEWWTNGVSVNSGKLFRAISPFSTREIVISEPFRILWAGVVMICCLTGGVAGETTTEPAASLSLTTSTDAESDASETASLHYRSRSTASAPDTAIRIDVYANGSAIWTVHYRFRLDGANETTAFTRLRGDIASHPDRYREQFEQRLTGAVARAENTTGREMAIKNVRVRAARNGTTGTITYTFVWRNFAATDGNRLQIGDALTGFSLDTGTRFTISWPDKYEPTTVRPAPADRRPNAVIWTASTKFNNSDLFVTLVRSGTTTRRTGSGSGPADESDGAAASGNDLSLPSIGLVALGLFVGGVGIVWFVRRRRTDDSTTATVASAPDARHESSAETSEAASPPDEDDPPATAATDDRPSLDLLSNEEQVVEVLKRSDGRAKQQHIIEELGWTDAKTSSVVSQLRDNGTIEGFRLGRENVLRLPDEDHETDTDDTTTDE
jgi:hypothetical protein